MGGSKNQYPVTFINSSQSAGRGTTEGLNPYRTRLRCCLLPGVAFQIGHGGRCNTSWRMRLTTGLNTWAKAWEVRIWVTRFRVPPNRYVDRGSEGLGKAR